MARTHRDPYALEAKSRRAGRHEDKKKKKQRNREKFRPYLSSKDLIDEDKYWDEEEYEDEDWDTY